MPGVPSRRGMDGYKRLAAAVIHRTILDARAGDAGAEKWLRGPMLPFSTVLDVDPEKLHTRLDQLLEAESLQHFAFGKEVK